MPRAEASVTSQLTYQARLWTAAGAPVADGTYSIKFSIYAASSGGTPVWTAAGTTGAPTAVSVTVTNGAFTVNLGESGQNSLSTVNWDQSSLYLGITVGSDTEMSPRRRITSVPQAFLAENALQLQGMYASSTVYGGQSLFTIHQTESSAATGTRTALEVRSQGMSDTDDFLIRGVNSSGTTAFSLNRAGSVTTTGDLAVIGGVNNRITTTTNMGQVNVSYAPASLANLKKTLIFGDRLYTNDESTIEVFDIADPARYAYIGKIQVDGPIAAFTIKGSIAYIVYSDTGTGTRKLGMYDVRRPTGSMRLGGLTLSITNTAHIDVEVNNQAVYVANGSDPLGVIYVIDAANLADPVLSQTISMTGFPKDLETDGRALYVTSNDGPLPGYLTIFGLQQPLRPSQESETTLTGTTSGTRFLLRGSTGYVLNTGSSHLSVLNVRNPAAPTLIQTMSLGAAPYSGYLLGERLFLGFLDGTMKVYNVSSSTAPSLIGSITVSAGQVIQGVAGSRNHVFAGFQASPYIKVYAVPGTTVDTFQGGRVGALSLSVDDDAQVGKTLNVGGALAVGQGGLLSSGPVIGSSSGTSPGGLFLNQAATTSNNSWGLFSNRLLVGDNPTATGSQSYVGLLAYNAAQSRFGLCLDNTNTASTCLGFADTSTVYSVLADDAIGANAFDLAERYAISGDAQPGDVLVLDPDRPFHMKRSPGIAYDSRVSGVVSTRPGFILGTGGQASVALVGRVPVRVSAQNGAIAPGDPLVASDQPGVAMRATRAGVIIGRALEAATADGLVEVYLQPGFDASSWLRADGQLTTIAQDTAFQAPAPASAAEPARSSPALAFRGSAWSDGQAVVSEFRLFNQVTDPVHADLSIAYGSSSVFSLGQNGSLALAGDLAVAGRIYPSARGHAQRENYLFVDDTVPDAPYLSTNANGWQSMGGYDYAERYQSPDVLEPGDLVVVHRQRRLYVQRSLTDRALPIGIVSTKPGFIAGRPQEDAYPIALAGRVPTKVSSINGAIAAGDPLAPSSIPGVAVKATRPGPIVGLALEPYAGSDVGKIEVFVNPTWWGGGAELVVAAENPPVRVAEPVPVLKKAQGFAEIVAGKTKVAVTLPGFIRYPHLQVTPYTQTEQGWWLERVSTQGFEIFLGGPSGHNVRFAWTAEEAPDQAPLSLSSGRTFAIDPISGEIQFPAGVSDQDPPPIPPPAQEQASSSEPTPEPQLEPAAEPPANATTTVPVSLETPTTTVPAVTEGMPVPSVLPASEALAPSTSTIQEAAIPGPTE